MANYLQQLVGTRQASDSSEFGYPSGANVFVLGNGSASVHLIYGAATDTMTSAGLDAAYANAPNGSIYVCMDGTTTKKLAIKFGNVGAKNGSFLFSSIVTAPFVTV